jgi:hypothetical protein
MSEATLKAIRELLAKCSEAERTVIFKELRKGRVIHAYEEVVGAPAEMILEAVYRAPELTRRMLRGVIADAAFRTFVIEALVERGWRDVTQEGNFAYDYKLDDGAGPITVQVKLQRSARGIPVVKDGARYGFQGDVFITETQKSRTGTDGEDNLTRPYRYGEFDVLAVSMQPSTGNWRRYMYTLGRWLIPGKTERSIATLQPVSATASEFWTDDFDVVAGWMRTRVSNTRLADHGAKVSKNSGRPHVAKK